VEIDAAHSRDDPERKAKKETVQYGGTSMAAPHVTGVVALMLQKNAKMTVTDVLKVFKDFPSNYAGATALTVEEGGLGRIDGNLAVTNTKP
jgi:subtilisin family serine protease